MYEIEIGKTDLSVLKQYLNNLKKRSARINHKKSLGKIRRQLEAVFSTKRKKRPAIPWGY